MAGRGGVDRELLFDETEPVASVLGHAAGCRAEAVDALREALSGEGPRTDRMAGRLGRLLEGLVEDPVGEALALLPSAPATAAAGLTFVLLRRAVPGDASRLQAALAEAPAAGEAGPRVTALCLGLARCGNGGSRQLLEAVKARFQAELAGASDELREYVVSGLAPPVAAAAAALLAISEREGTGDEADLPAWRATCVELARATEEGPPGSFHLPPMPFLFCGQPRATAAVLVAFFQAQRWRGMSTAYLAWWLALCAENGVRPTVDGAAPGVSRLVAEAEERVRRGGDEPELAAYEVLSALAPERARTWAAEALSSRSPGSPAVALAAEEVRRTSSPERVPALLLEQVFAEHDGPGDPTEHLARRKELDRVLREGGLASVEGFRWAAPPPGAVAVASDEFGGLEASLRAVSNACATAAAAQDAVGAARALEPLPAPAAPPLVRHARYRCLLGLLGEAPDHVRTAVEAALGTLAGEPDASLARHVDTVAGYLCGLTPPVVLLALLQTPAVRHDPSYGCSVVDRLPRQPWPEALAALRALRDHAAPLAKTSHDDFSRLVAACDRALDALRLPPTPDEVLADPAPRPRAVLRLLQSSVAETIPEAGFARLFTGLVLEGQEYLSDEELALLVGPRAGAFIVERLRSSPSRGELLKLCRLLGLPGRPEPPEALALLLPLLGPAIAAARRAPGHAFGDDLYRGYSTTDAEAYAEALSVAVNNLASSSYDRGGWLTLLESLLGLPGPDLRAVETVSVCLDEFPYGPVSLLERMATALTPRGLALAQPDLPWRLQVERWLFELRQ